MLSIQTITVNHMRFATGIEGPVTLCWGLSSDRRNVRQQTCRIVITPADHPESIVYDSGEVCSSASANVRVKAAWRPLTRYTVRVSVSDGVERCEGETQFTTALCGAPWQGAFVSAEPEADAAQSYGTCIRAEFTAEKPVREAWFVGTAHGVYRAYVNGRRVGADEMAPGWTAYEHRLLYQTEDITDKVAEGVNTLAIELGAGWYKGELSYYHKRNIYGSRTAFGGQLLLRYADGTEQTFASDESWRGAKSPVLFSELYDGEIYDARLEEADWRQNGFDASAWGRLERVERDESTLVPQQGRGVRVIETISPKRLFKTPAGETVVDFGQNLTGRCRFTVRGARAGDIAELRFFEILDADGNVYTENLRTAKQCIRYICKGEAEEVFEPLFTFQGGAFIQLTAWPNEPKPEDFTALVMHTDMEETGSFCCSNALINRLEHNILWGMKGNFFDVPTDCPQRDERLGWTGDAQIFCSTAAFLMNTYAFYRKYLLDMAADQQPDGGIGSVIPDCNTRYCVDKNNRLEGSYGASAWGDAAVIMPWTLYLAHGDTAILEEMYDCVKGWIDFMRDHSTETVLFRFALQYGDWLALDAEEGSYFGATPTDYTSAAYYTYSTGLFAKIAVRLGREEDAKAYGALYKRLRAAFRAHFIHDDGTLTVDTQTAHVCALALELVDAADKPKIAAGLKRLLDAAGGHLKTGFIGTPHIARALSENGCLDDAFALLLKEDLPSWLYPVRMGATTVWEHWDGLKPDGTMWDPQMNSFNHYSYGSIGDWLYRSVAGLDRDEAAPGYENIRLCPHIGGGLTFAELQYESERGTIRTRWSVDNNTVTLACTIPANCTADIVLEQAKRVFAPDGLAFERAERGFAAKAGSGSYAICFEI